jgi:hypothetical protein
MRGGRITQTHRTNTVGIPNPLLIRELVRAGVAHAPDQEVVYAANKRRMTYREVATRAPSS